MTIDLSEKDFIALRDYMYQHYGIDLSKKRELIKSRLSLVVQKNGFKGFSDYIANLIADKSGTEASLIVSRLTTNYTYFMREENHFKFLTDQVIPYFAPKIKDKCLRTWSAGCSSGEEPYTLAMVYDSYFGHEKAQWDTVILATDISDNVLSIAKAGVYSGEKMSAIPAQWKTKYFSKADDTQFEVNSRIKNEVEFRKFNLMEKKFNFRKPFHVIFCRNVMIYFDAVTRQQLVERFYDSLEPGGFLIIGMSESLINYNTRFKYVMPAIYQK